MKGEGENERGGGENISVIFSLNVKHTSLGIFYPIENFSLSIDAQCIN